MMMQVLIHCNANFETMKWKDRALAKQLIAQGMSLALSGQMDAIEMVVKQLLQLIIGDVPGGGTLK
jgi:hypothetical protein